jgi:CO/xanthine dehydrogenase Mo-binding subunit
VPENEIRLAQADTDEVAIGGGTYAFRSMMIGGSALRAAADIAFADRNFTIVGTDLPMPATPECIRRAIREQMPS